MSNKTLEILKRLIKENITVLDEGGWGAYREIPYQENTRRFFDVLNDYSLKRKTLPPSEDLLERFLVTLRKELNTVYPDPTTKDATDSPISAYKTVVEKAIDLFDSMYRGRMASMRAEYGTDHAQIERNIMKILGVKFNKEGVPGSGFAEIFGGALAGSYETPLEPSVDRGRRAIGL
jgi:hypothetical protein